MTHRRIHCFEVNDSTVFPAFLRESIIEILGKTISNGAIYAPALPLFEQFCRRSRCDTILDLCSGSGESAAMLMQGLKEADTRSVRCYLSDLQPARHALSAQVRQHPDRLQQLDHPVDACHVSDVPPHQARTLVAAFHHFKPDQAERILRDAVATRTAIFILEPFPPRLKHTLPFFIKSFIPGALNPLTSHKDQWLKALFTYLLPIIPLLGWWDTVISALRMYPEQELRQMVAGSDDYCWEYQQLTTPLWGAITVFTGIPNELLASDPPR